MSALVTQITVMLMLTVLILEVVSSVSVERAFKEMVESAQVCQCVQLRSLYVQENVKCGLHVYPMVPLRNKYC